MRFRDLIDGNVSVGTGTMDFDSIAFDARLDEAAFSEKNVQKVVKLYSRIMGKKLGGDFFQVGIETYKRKWGPGRGVRTINNKGAQLRFNWDAKFVKASNYELTSIDYWAPTNTDFQHPTRTVKLAPELNVVQILDKLTDALLTGSLSEANDCFAAVNVLYEARTKDERLAFAAQHGLPPTAARSDKYLRGYGVKKGISEQVEIFLGAKESNSFEGEIKKVEKSFDKQVYANPDTVFEDIEDLLGVVASGKWRTLIVCGQGGIGKTYHITEGGRSLKELLGPEGDKWTYHSGVKASPLAFYRTLFQEREQIIVFDEADAVLKHSEIIMMLKPILDTSGGNMAEYLTGTKNMVGKSDAEIDKYSRMVGLALERGASITKAPTKRLWDPFTMDLEGDMTEYDVMLPSKFAFTGGMVFISNMRANQIEQAIMSRSIFIDVYLAEQDVLKRCKSIGYAIADNSPSRTREDIDAVLAALGESSSAPEQEITYMTPEYARKSKQVTVRALQLGLILKEAGLSRWQDLVALYA